MGPKEYVLMPPTVRTSRSLERSAAEADFVAVGVAVDHLAHAVPVRFLCGGLYSPGPDAADPVIEVVDEHSQQHAASAFGQFRNVQVPVPGELPYRQGRDREECGFGAHQPLIPGERALVFAYREARE